MKRFVFPLVLLLAVADAGAQGLSTLNPLAAVYSLIGFAYEPPKGDGWRELASTPDAVRIVYAEQLAADQINTRADFGAQAFPVSEPDKIPDAATLARMSMAQRTQEKGKDLVAMSKLEPVEGAGVPMFEYTLVAKVESEDYFENYFVALAPDKTQYLAGKLVTKEKDFREQPYYAPFRASMLGLKFRAAEKPNAPEPSKAAPAPPA